LEGADVVMLLRLQLERQSGGLFPSIREYRERYGLDLDKLEKLLPHAVIMHPGPINRGIELASDVADGSRSVILDQVTNGVAVRMAVLYLLGGSESD
jgi:aspartate carbamoyltransferase catalytic subunit